MSLVYFNFKDYFQKSLVFLYPLIGIKKKEMFTPINTYLYCNSIEESILDYKLIVLYRHEEKSLFEKWEKEVLLKNKYLSNTYIIDEGVVFIFDLSDFKDCVDSFLTGEYTKFPVKLKELISLHYLKVSEDYKFDIKDFIDNKFEFGSGTIFFITSMYFNLFKENTAKELINVDYYNTLGEAKEVLKDMSEICPMFDLTKETL